MLVLESWLRHLGPLVLLTYSRATSPVNRVRESRVHSCSVFGIGYWFRLAMELSQTPILIL